MTRCALGLQLLLDLLHDLGRNLTAAGHAGHTGRSAATVGGRRRLALGLLTRLEGLDVGEEAVGHETRDHEDGVVALALDVALTGLVCLAADAQHDGLGVIAFTGDHAHRRGTFTEACIGEAQLAESPGTAVSLLTPTWLAQKQSKTGV